MHGNNYGNIKNWCTRMLLAEKQTVIKWLGDYVCSYPHDDDMAIATTTTKNSISSRNSNSSNNEKIKSIPNRYKMICMGKKQNIQTLHIKCYQFFEFELITFLMEVSFSFRFNCTIIEYKLKQPKMGWKKISVDIMAMLFFAMPSSRFITWHLF